MNRPIRLMAGFLAVLLVALLINITVIQVFQASNYRDHVGNQRNLLAEYGRERGPILVGNDPVARSVVTGNTLMYQRT